MNTFLLRPPKIFVPYLNKSLTSVLSEGDCSISRAECEEWLKQTKHDDCWEGVDKEESSNAVANVQNQPRELLLEFDKANEEPDNSSSIRTGKTSVFSREKKLRRDFRRL